jgi:hypothetical protein
MNGACDTKEDQDRQCTKDVTVWRFRVTTVAVGRQKCRLRMLLSYVSPSPTCIYKYRVLHNNASVTFVFSVTI